MTELTTFFYVTAFATIAISVFTIVVVVLFWKQDKEVMKTYPKEVDWLLSMDDCQTENMPS